MLDDQGGELVERCVHDYVLNFRVKVATRSNFRLYQYLFSNKVLFVGEGDDVGVTCREIFAAKMLIRNEYTYSSVQT